MVRSRAIIGVALLAATLAPEPCRAAISRSQEVRARSFKLLTDGIKAHKEGRSKEAIPLLEEATRIALNSFRAYYYLGLALKADRQYQRAITPLQVALELDPQDLQARIALGDCYLWRGEPAEALAEYHRALAQSPDYAPAFDGLGRTAEAAGEDEKAIEHFKKAIALNPGFPDASLNLGDLYLRAGRNQEAIDLFLQVIKVRPDFAAAYNRIGAAYARQRLNNEAVAALRQAETLERGNPWHSVTVGGIFLGMDHLLLAEREFDRAHQLDPDYLEGYLAMAELRRRQGDLPAALRVLDEGLAGETEDPRGRARLEELRASIAAEAAEMETLRAKLAASPDDAAALERLAALRADQGGHDEASGYLKRALAALPSATTSAERTRVRSLLAYNALRAGLYDDAAAALESLTQANPADAAAWINLGLARAGRGDDAGAERALREAARLIPGDPRPFAGLANLQAMSGRREEAAASLTTALGLLDEQSPDRARMERLLKAVQGGEAR